MFIFLDISIELEMVTVTNVVIQGNICEIRPRFERTGVMSSILNVTITASLETLTTKHVCPSTLTIALAI